MALHPNRQQYHCDVSATSLDCVLTLRKVQIDVPVADCLGLLRSRLTLRVCHLS